MAIIFFCKLSVHILWISDKGWIKASQVALVVKNPSASVGEVRGVSLIPGFGKILIPQRTEWLPTPVFLLGEFHGQRSLGGLQSIGL